MKKAEDYPQNFSISTIPKALLPFVFHLISTQKAFDNYCISIILPFLYSYNSIMP